MDVLDYIMTSSNDSDPVFDPRVFYEMTWMFWIIS